MSTNATPAKKAPAKKKPKVSGSTGKPAEYPAKILNPCRSLAAVQKKLEEIKASVKASSAAVGAYFRERRAELHLKQKTVAEALNMGLTKYNQMELGAEWEIEDVKKCLAFFAKAEAEHAEHLKSVHQSAARQARPAKPAATTPAA